MERDDIQIFFSDLFRFGCVSGMIDSLVYTADTQEFYDKHHDQIEMLCSEFEDKGCPVKIGYDLKNDYAWFAFEVTASRLAEKLGIEV